MLEGQIDGQTGRPDGRVTEGENEKQRDICIYPSHHQTCMYTYGFTSRKTRKAYPATFQNKVS